MFDEQITKDVIKTIALSAYSLLEKSALSDKTEEFKQDLKKIARKIYHTNLARSKVNE